MSAQVNATCKNCGHPATENFCANCGQSTDVKRFDGRYLIYKIVHSIDLDRGFFHTIYQLIIRPGAAIRDYVHGKRVGFSNPFKLFLIIGAIATYYTLHSGNFQDNVEVDANQYFGEWIGFLEYSGRYYSFFQVTGSLVFSLFTWLIFIRSGYNFHEIVVLNFYIAVGQLIILLLFSLPAFLLDTNYFDGSSTLGMVYAAFNFGYHLWVIVTFFRTYKLRTFIYSLLVTIVPTPFSVTINYWIYVMAPSTFWEYLDSILM